MISASEIIEAGRFNKPHGIKGEISATLDLDVDLAQVRCIVMDVEGIYVPFFITGVRPKTADTCLITLDGVDSEQKARAFATRPFYLLESDVPEDEDDGGDGFYAADLVGFSVIDETYGNLGVITGVNDVTENVLFELESPAGAQLLLPVADEFILSVDPDALTVETSYPEGILDLNH